MQIGDVLRRGSRDFSHVSGISFVDDGRVVTTLPNVVQDLDELPVPAWDLLPLGKYWEIARPHGGGFDPENQIRYASLMTSRGCPFKCEFCHISREDEGSISGNIRKLRLKSEERVIHEIESDIATGIPMLRLLQGDVGAGKTAVAAVIASILIDAGYQVALMAPTELLAQQHARQAEEWFGPLGIDTVMLTSRLTKSKRAPLLERLASARSAFVVGTHALFQVDVTYGNLGLIIVDEQHRFGVEQRLALRDKGVQDGYRPHQLIMTATPIPRTLAMTAYADLDVSTLDELPAGRKPVQTAIVPTKRRDEAIERISNALSLIHI